MAEPEVTGGNSDTTPPLTFESAYAADSSPLSDSPSSDSTTTPAAAQPGAEQGSPQPTEDNRSPYMPRARFDEVNTRMKAAEDRVKTLAWAEQVDQQTLSEAIQFYGRYKGDTVDFIQQLIVEAQTDPVASAKLRSIEARHLAQGRSQPQQVQAPATIPIITLEDGSQVDLNALKTQWLQEAQQQVAPDLQTLKELQAEREQAAADKAAQTFATDFLTEVRKLPNFGIHEPKIKADLAVLIKQGKVGDHPAELKDAVRSLYIQHDYPTREASVQSRQLDDLQRKAAASTGINPGSSAPTSPRRPTSFNDPSLKW